MRKNKIFEKSKRDQLGTKMVDLVMPTRFAYELHEECVRDLCAYQFPSKVIKKNKNFTI